VFVQIQISSPGRQSHVNLLKTSPYFFSQKGGAYYFLQISSRVHARDEEMEFNFDREKLEIRATEEFRRQWVKNEKSRAAKNSIEK
jgi:hypothetical protein